MYSIIYYLSIDVFDEGAETSAEYEEIAGESKKLIGAAYSQMKELLETKTGWEGDKGGFHLSRYTTPASGAGVTWLCEAHAASTAGAKKYEGL